jgi:hypothetical protein
MQRHLDQSSAVQAADLQSEGHVPLALSAARPVPGRAPGLPVSTLHEFIDYVKAHPGEVNYGSSGVGSIITCR